MRVGRTSTGSRIISALLVLCMIIGMIPAGVITLPVFAADSTTATNVSTVMTYASSILNSNYSKAGSATQNKSDAFSWDKEGKTDDWRYYNGLMVDAFLMAGMNSGNGNALEFAASYYNANVNSSGYIARYNSKDISGQELDSIQPARALFDLLGTVVDQDKYETVLHNMYTELMSFPKVDGTDGNFRHKDSWTDHEIGLDGIYMAQPFLMEYANAIDRGLLSNTKNVNTSEIYEGVYKRMLWVINNMSFTDASGNVLLNHGYDADGTNNVSSTIKGNGVVWSRGVGWFMAGLVDVIEMMPAGAYKDELIAELSDLLDGMLAYQHSSGMWYNVVYGTNGTDVVYGDGVTGNRLEVSGTALMTYALLKAYNNGWVTDSTYKTKGLAAFNGMFAQGYVTSTNVTNIYKSAGVGMYDEIAGEYCNDAKYDGNSSEASGDNEAKGVGPLIMAAVEANKANGASESFDIGVVVAPEMAVAKGATSLSTTNGIEATLVSNYGTVANGVASYLNYEVGDTGGSTATVKVYNGSTEIDTFTVKVVDTSSTNTVTGTFYVEETVTDIPTAPSVTAGNWVQISAGGDGTTEYVLYSSKDYSSVPAGNYIIVYSTNGANGKALKNVTSAVGGGTAPDTPMDVTIVDGKINFGSASATDIGYAVWTVGDDSYVGNGSNYLQDGQDEKLLNKKSNANAISFAVDSGTTGGWLIYLQSGRPMGWGSSNFERLANNSTGVNVFLFNATTGASGDPEYGMLSGTEAYAYAVGTATNDSIIAKIKSDYTVQSATDSNGTGATPVDWSNVTLTWDKTLDVSTAGTYTATVTYGGKTLGTIPVLIYGGTVEVAYQVEITVPSGYVADFEYVNQYVGYMNISSNVTNASGNSVNGASCAINVESENTGIATYSGSNINAQSVGSTNIVVSVDTVTYNGEDYPVTGVSAKVPVVINDKTWTTVTYETTGATMAPATVEVGKTTQAHGYAKASDGSDHSYTFTWTSGNTGVATVDSSTGVITANSVGTATITGTLAKIDGVEVWNYAPVTVTVTVVAASEEEPTEPVAPEYTYTILGSNGSALAGQNITLNKGETYSPSFSVSDGTNDVTSSYTMTLEATSNSGAVDIDNETRTITANTVNSDTVVNIRATVTPNSRATAEGTSVDFTVTVKASATSDDGNDDTIIVVPSVSADTVYTKLTAINSNITYAVIGRNSNNRTATHGTDPGVQEASWTAVDDGWKYGAVAHLWVIEKIENSSNYHIYYMDGTTKYYLNGDGSNNLVCATTPATEWALSFSGETVQITVASGTGGNANNRIHLNVDGSAGPKFESSAQSLVLYAPVDDTPAVTYSATLTLNSDGGDLYVGNGQTLTPTVVITDSNGNVVNNASYTINWNSSNTSAVEVYDDGVIYVKGAASGVVITASISEITVGETPYSVSASDTATFNSTLKTVSTGPQRANAGDLVTFTVAANIPNGSWGKIDNVKVYRDGNLVTTITDGSCWKNPVGFEVKDGLLNLWIENGGSGTATYSFIADAAGDYTVVYELEGDAAVTNDATVTESLTAQTPTYTYQLFAPNGTLMGTSDGAYNTQVIYPTPTFTVEVGDTWTPYVVVTRNDGADVSSNYVVRVQNMDYNMYVDINGADVTAKMTTPSVWIASIAVFDASGTVQIAAWQSTCNLIIIEASPELWVDASTGWRPNSSAGYPLDSSTKTWTYTSVTENSAADWWDVSNVTIRDAEGNEMAVIRADAYGWTYDPVTDTTAELIEVGTQDNVPDTWMNDNKAGVTIKVTAKLDGDYIIVAVSTTNANGVETTNSYVIYNEGGTTPSIFFSGEECKLYDPSTTATALDISAAESAVDKLESLNLSLNVPDLWIEAGRTGTAAPTVLNGEDAITYTVSYSVVSGTTASLQGSVFTANALGATNAIAYVTSVTVDGVVIPVTNVSDTFVVNTKPVWEGKQTGSVTVEAGQTVTFTYSGDMPGVQKGAGYVDDVRLIKVNSDGSTEEIWYDNFNDNNLDGWVTTNDFNDIQGSKVFGTETAVYRSLRLWRGSNEPYQNLSASYSIVVEEPGTYYFTYNQMIESPDGIGTMTGSISKSETQYSTTDFTIATEMVDGKQYFFNNASNSERVASWVDGGWTTGTVDKSTIGTVIGTVYTPDVQKGELTLWTWEAVSATTGYFYITDANGNKQYLAEKSGDSTMTVSETGTLFTVAITTSSTNVTSTQIYYTGDGGTEYLKLESSYVSGKTGNSSAKTYLYTPASTTGVTPEEYTGTVTPGTVTVEQGATTVDASLLTGVSMTYTDSNGTQHTVSYSDLVIDRNIKTDNSGNKYIDVKYTSGNVTVTGVIWVVEQINAITYELFTGDPSTIQNGDIFLIVSSDQKWALMNDDDGDSDSIAGLSASVTINGNYAIIGSDDDPYATWTVSSWKEGSKDGAKYYTLILGNDKRYIRSSSSNILGESGKTLSVFKTSTPGLYALSSNQTVSDGTLVADGDFWYYDTENSKWIRSDTAGYVYLYKQTVITSGVSVTAPGNLYIAQNGAANVLPSHTMQYVVQHNGSVAGANDYTITWNSSNTNVASIDANGVITGYRSGTSTITATVTMKDGTVYTENVNVTVIGPNVSVDETLEMIVGDSETGTATLTPTVNAGGVQTSNYTLYYLSDNPDVASVDPVTGKVTAVSEGTATIYTVITHVNGFTLYSETPTVDTIQGAYDYTEVTVSNKEIVDGHLNSYDFVVHSNTNNDKSPLVDVLEFKENITGAVTAEEGLKLTIVYNNGDEEVIKFVDANNDGTDDNNPGFKVDLGAVNMTREGIYYVDVSYTVGEEIIFEDTIWVHVVDIDLDQYDGIVNWESEVTYILETDDIDINDDYVIVYKESNSSGIALRNPSIYGSGSSTASTASVTLSGNTLNIASSDSMASAWLLDTLVGSQNNSSFRLNASNTLRYLGLGSTTRELIHNNAGYITMVPVDKANGAYQIIVGYNRGTPYYLTYVNGQWTAGTTAQTLYLYHKNVGMLQDYSLDFDLLSKDSTEIISDTRVTEEKALGIPDGYEYNRIIPNFSINLGELKANNYTIVWTSSNPRVATVDQNGVVTAISEGYTTITATLYEVNGMTVVCNIHNTEHISKTVVVHVTEADPKPVLNPNYMEIGIGTMPNFTKVHVEMTYPGTTGEFNYNVPFDQLTFKLADATGYATNEDGAPIDANGNVVSEGNAMQLRSFNSNQLGVYYVPVAYAGREFILTIRVVSDPYAGLDTADSIPGYPDAGSVRMNKSANGVLDFTETGVTKIELTAAGVSTKSSVDVVLIVDVSNSMGWSLDWFSMEKYNAYVAAEKAAGTSERDIKDYAAWWKSQGDNQKGPAGGAAGTDKLDMAMESAIDFADILLNVEGGDNTITFVTFAGADRDHNGSEDYVDSVRTPMVGVSEYSIAESVFLNTKFTNVKYLDGSTNKGEYVLQIGGYVDDNGYGQAQTSGSNRGNTNYDYAFGQAISAVNQLKKQYSERNNGKSYDDSGRQIHVVFMTDGAPSHYNSEKANGGAADTLWDGSGKNYTMQSDATVASWLSYIENYNKLATQLKDMIDGAYSVGFDMAHGGFGSFSFDLDDMERVLLGLAKNTIVPVTMADDEKALNDYYTSLARALAYAGTTARVEDKIGTDFSLFTGVSMYSEDIIDKDIMSEDTYNAMVNYGGFPITVYSYRLVTASDVAAGQRLSVIMTDGSIQTVVPKEEHLGLRVNEEPDILEQITFSADGKQAFSDKIEDADGNPINIMTDTDSNGDGVADLRTINAATFTYTATLDTMTVDGKTVSHAADETIRWKIGNITDREVSMQYYAYLDGSLDNPRVAVEGVYATNEYAYLEYIDVYGKYVKRDYGVPQVAWGKANVTVRFFLVNERGEFVNRAGVTFTNPANRIFLEGRAEYEYDLYNSVEISALDALTKAGLAGNNILYDVSAHATVTNFTTAGGGDPVQWFMNNNLNNIANLLIDIDTSGGYGASVILDIPVIMQDEGQSERPLSSTTVVMDYGKPMDISVFSEEELKYVAGWKDYRNGTNELFFYDMAVVGFATYNSSFDQRDYILKASVKEWQPYSDINGTFSVLGTGNGSTQVRFTPGKMLENVETVFAVIKFSEYNIVTENGVDKKGEPTDLYYYMYKQVNIVPATVMYYETDGNMGGAFIYKDGTKYSLSAEDGATSNESQNMYTPGAAYGYDSTYETDAHFSNGSSMLLTGEGFDKTQVEFTFTGTGFDIISRTGEHEGTIRVWIYDRNGNEVRKISVINKGVGELYQIPVVSVDDLSYGTYKVVIGVMQGYKPAENSPYYDVLYRGSNFYFDAVRIYGAMTGTESFVEGASMVNGAYTTTSTTVNNIYASDGERAPQILPVGDLIVDKETYLGTSVEGATGILYLDDNGVFENDSTASFEDAIATYNAIGPNHEVYLANGQGIAFVLNVADLSSLGSLDIGAKSVDGRDVVLSVRLASNESDYYVEKNIVIQTGTAQYYDLLNGVNLQQLFGSDNKAYVIIKNGNAAEAAKTILSLTALKVAYGHEVSSASITFERNLAFAAYSFLHVPTTELGRSEDGNWYYYVDGEVDTTYTGLVEHATGTWYVQSGQVIFTHNGMVTFEGEQYYIKGGQVDTSVNGIENRDGTWMYFVNGMVDTSVTAMIEKLGDLWYVDAGYVDFNKSGLVEHEGRLLYVRYGQHIATYVGLQKSDDGQWLYVNQGAVDYNYTGFAKYGENWWYVMDGAVNFNYSGTASNGTVTYHVEYGLVDAANPIYS